MSRRYALLVTLIMQLYVLGSIVNSRDSVALLGGGNHTAWGNDRVRLTHARVATDPLPEVLLHDTLTVHLEFAYSTSDAYAV